MGTTFVTISQEPPSEDEIGFWMRDDVLQLWLRLLALHFPEPTSADDEQAVYSIRNQWLLASSEGFTGCVPHGLEDACATEQGLKLVRYAVTSLIAAIDRSSGQLDSETLALLSPHRDFFEAIERDRLRDVGTSFLALLDGKWRGTVKCRPSILPGSTPIA